jgi:hypothetical protein
LVVRRARIVAAQLDIYRPAAWPSGESAPPTAVQAAEATAREIDVAVRDIIAEAFDRAVNTARLDLVPFLLLEFLHSMLLIIDNGGCQRHGARHADVSQGDNNYSLFFRRHDMAHDATFVAGI